MVSEGTPPPRGRGRPHKRTAEMQEWIRFREDGDRKRRFEDAVLRMDTFGNMSATLREFVRYFIGDTNEVPPRPRTGPRQSPDRG